MALEAMAAGAVPVMSQSFGINEYATNNENAFIIDEVNNAEKYVDKIVELLQDEDKLKKMSKSAQLKSLEFDIDKNINCSYFEQCLYKNFDLCYL